MPKGSYVAQFFPLHSASMSAISESRPGAGVFEKFQCRCLELLVGDQTVKEIMLPSGWYQWVGKIYAYLSVHLFRTGLQSINKPGMNGFCKLYGPEVEDRPSRGPAHPVRHMHPFA